MVNIANAKVIPYQCHLDLVMTLLQDICTYCVMRFAGGRGTCTYKDSLELLRTTPMGEKQIARNIVTSFTDKTNASKPLNTAEPSFFKRNNMTGSQAHGKEKERAEPETEVLIERYKSQGRGGRGNMSRSLTSTIAYDA